MSTDSHQTDIPSQSPNNRVLQWLRNHPDERHLRTNLKLRDVWPQLPDSMHIVISGPESMSNLLCPISLTETRCSG